MLAPRLLTLSQTLLLLSMALYLSNPQITEPPTEHMKIRMAWPHLQVLIWRSAGGPRIYMSYKFPGGGAIAGWSLLQGMTLGEPLLCVELTSEYLVLIPVCLTQTYPVQACNLSWDSGLTKHRVLLQSLSRPFLGGSVCHRSKKPESRYAHLVSS